MIATKYAVKSMARYWPIEGSFKPMKKSASPMKQFPPPLNEPAIFTVYQFRYLDPTTYE